MEPQELKTMHGSRHMFFLAHLDSECNQAQKLVFRYLKHLYYGICICQWCVGRKIKKKFLVITYFEIFCSPVYFSFPLSAYDSDNLEIEKSLNRQIL